MCARRDFGETYGGMFVCIVVVCLVVGRLIIQSVGSPATSQWRLGGLY